MNRFPNPSLDRRQLLRNGGLALSMSAIVAACGSNRGGSTDPGRLGVAEAAPEAEQGEINDIVLLRTAQSLEYTALAVYDAAAATGVLSSAEAALTGRFVEDHTGHAAALGTLITAGGGRSSPARTRSSWIGRSVRFSAPSTAPTTCTAMCSTSPTPSRRWQARPTRPW